MFVFLCLTYFTQHLLSLWCVVFLVILFLAIMVSGNNSSLGWALSMSGGRWLLVYHRQLYLDQMVQLCSRCFIFHQIGLDIW